MAKSEKLVPIIRKWEGGYSSDPTDLGNNGTGCTNSGITLTTFRKYYGSKMTCKNLRMMATSQWNYIFKKGYWDKWKADEIESQSIANLLVDWYWNSGTYGIKYPQEILGVVADGIVGKKTIGAINGYKDKKELFTKLWERRKKHYEDIVKRNPSQKKFMKGWMNRLNSFTFSD